MFVMVVEVLPLNKELYLDLLYLKQHVIIVVERVEYLKIVVPLVMVREGLERIVPLP